ncbi:MAG: hypothetical protein NXY57DRAFT_1046588 [Lentinula lateritia]|uniref:Arrestin-like N-terminal domain-containing protein n=1 Tax=Lentinula lateritia TaxID=40482 RepID=A0ABQ8VZI4_9AGAR|nr:MAG: hypothetical protein NXY57DRAFT_1046588 [Lentinula lateritia]KAJ4500925.1 hypothetical protein C8R41DRAFT_913989 [Lentinula lateritia]
MDALSPPPYRQLSRQGQASYSGSELPRYTRRNTLVHPVAPRDPTQHVFSLSDGRARPWLVLRVASSAKSTKSLPIFYEKENINATLELHAEKGDSSIQSVMAMVRGRVITGPRSDETVTFLTIYHPIWARSVDTPRTPSPSEGASGSKLFGDCVWSFSIPLPKTVAVGKSDVQFRLPETFSERDFAASVQYDLTIHISRAKLRADSQIRTPFGYVPSSKPEPPSILRQLAYQQSMPVPGPSADPRGWETLKTCKAKGTTLQNCPADVRCSLSLAKPLCYTRGSVIPCSLTLSSSDPQALDMITASDCVNVGLRRTVGYTSAPGIEKKRVAYQESSREFGKAVWWPSASVQGDRYNRHLEGEIRLAKDLRPTSLMDHFSISYSVVLRSFNISALKSAHSEILLSEPVNIVAAYAKGPRPIAYAPPAYDPYSRENDQDY